MIIIVKTQYNPYCVVSAIKFTAVLYSMQAAHFTKPYLLQYIFQVEVFLVYWQKNAVTG